MWAPQLRRISGAYLEGQALGSMLMYYLFTLDSHEFFGPFTSQRELHDWAKFRGAMSYQVVTRLHWNAELRKPW